jgi:hypothetical protein
MEGRGRGQIYGPIIAFAWIYWGKPQNALVSRFQAEIWTQDLPTTKQKC